MKTTTHRDDRDMRSRQPIFGRRVSASEWPDMRITYLHRDGSLDLVRADQVTWLDDRPLGLCIPAATKITHLTAAEYKEAGFWLAD